MAPGRSLIFLRQVCFGFARPGLNGDCDSSSNEANIMKPSRFFLTLAVVVLTASAAVAEQPSSEQITLKYASASDIYNLIKQEFGSSVVSLTTPVDIRMNSLKIDPADTQAKKVRELITGIDRPARR